MLRLLARAVLLALGIVVIGLAAVALYIGAGWRAQPRLDGTLTGLPLRDPVVVLRDARGIPHIRARTVRDLTVAQGYVEGADRLFQIDLIRHFVYGRLAEWFGSPALASDERARAFDIRRVIDVQYSRLTPRERDGLNAFAAGINAAMRREPLPVEYRLLFLRPERWRPEDSLAVGFATVLDLIDPWDDVIERDRVYRRFGAAGAAGLYSISDARYDVPIVGGKPAKLPPLAALPPAALAVGDEFPATANLEGSNEWAAGSAHSSDGHALLANDPHLTIRIPGVWYLVDLEAPGLHVAGASLAGTPGVILGHNAHIAWAATNGSVVSESVYEAGDPVSFRTERFHVRFGADAVLRYADDKHGFVIGTRLDSRRFSVDWPAVRDPVSGLGTFGRLDRATSIEAALAALRTYPGPTQNFVIADTKGEVAYHLAGDVPDDPLWGLRVHPASDPGYPPIPFDRLPHVGPSRDAVVYTANNRMYGADYRLRLSPVFKPPYRAARIAQLLHSHSRYDVGYFAEMQRDTVSLPEREFAERVVAAARRLGATADPRIAELVALLAAWNGRLDPASRAATIANAVRIEAETRFVRRLFPHAEEAQAYHDGSSDLVVMLRALRERPKGFFPRDDPDGFLVGALRAIAQRPDSRWSSAGAIPVRHPLASLGINWFNGVTLPGDGDGYTVHAQIPYQGQSFRAVWDTGNWDAGGIVIPSGESGRPGSRYYTDQSPGWIAQKLVSLPFTRHVVDAAARHRLVLAP